MDMKAAFSISLYMDYSIMDTELCTYDIFLQ